MTHSIRRAVIGLGISPSWKSDSLQVFLGLLRRRVARGGFWSYGVLEELARARIFWGAVPAMLDEGIIFPPSRAAVFTRPTTPLWRPASLLIRGQMF